MASVTGVLAIVVLATANATPLLRNSVTLSLVDASDAAAANSKEVLNEKIRDYRAVNPNFSEENCGNMYATKQKLGSAVPPSDFVTGCDEVCSRAKAMKEYWGSGEMADFACKHSKAFGCVWDGTPPVTPADIGC